jgi:hypothetical protein
MSVSGVCGCTDWAATQQAMGETRAGAAKPSGGDGDGGGRTHGAYHGHRRHGGGMGGIMQAIRAVLDQLVAQAGGAASETSATQTDSVSDPASGAVTTDAAASDTTAKEPTAAGGGASAGDTRHALHAFIHTLFQTLAGAPATTAAPATGGTDADGDNDGSTSAAPEAAGNRYGYRTPGPDLGTLAAGAASDGTSGGASSGVDLSALQASFQNLLDALGAGGSGITLQSFLQTLLTNLGGAQAPATDTSGTTGSLLTVSA